MVLGIFWSSSLLYPCTRPLVVFCSGFPFLLIALPVFPSKTQNPGAVSVILQASSTYTSDEIPPEPPSWTILAFSAFPQITISQSSSSSIAGLAPVFPCLPRTGLSTPRMTSLVLSTGKDQPPWPAGTTLPLADQCTPSNWPLAWATLFEPCPSVSFQSICPLI